MYLIAVIKFNLRTFFLINTYGRCAIQQNEIKYLSYPYFDKKL